MSRFMERGNTNDMSEAETLSSFWRHRRSSDRPIALRDLQLELTYLARLILDDQAVQIAWHKDLLQNQPMPSVEYINPDADAEEVPEQPLPKKAIILDSAPIEDIPIGEPIPDDRVDALVGDTTFRAYLEKLTRNQSYQEAARQVRVAQGKEEPNFQDTWAGAGVMQRLRNEMAGIDTDYDRIMSVLSHRRAYYQSLDTPPAVIQYVNTSLKWKREALQPIVDWLAGEIEQQPTLESVLDLWSLALVYKMKLPEVLDSYPDVLQAIQDAQTKAHDLIRRDDVTPYQVLDTMKGIAQAFSVVPKRINPPPMGESEGGDDEDSEEQEGDDDQAESEGQSSPDGTEKQNEGEEPEGGPDDEEGDSDSDSEEQEESSGDEQSSVSGGEDEEGEPDSDEQALGSGSEDSDSEEEEDFDDDSDEDGSEDDDRDDVDEESESSDSNDSSDDEAEAEIDPLERIKQQSQGKPLLDLVDQMDSLSTSEVEDIKTSIEFAREDITDEVESYQSIEQLGHGITRRTPILWEKAPYDAGLEAALRNDAYKNATGITQILQRFKRMRSRTEHGQLDGYKLDRRRLGRLTYQNGNPKVWQRRSIIDKLDMTLVLLMDSSGSIGNRQWNLIMQTGAAFVQALAGRDDVEFIAESYAGAGANMMIRHYDKRLGKYHAIRSTEGSTPSAMALASIRESIFKRLGVRHRDKIVIHLTDGDPNESAAIMRQQVELNKKAHIETFCILVQDIGYSQSSYSRTLQRIRAQRGEDTKSKLEAVYGKNWQILESYDKLLPCLTELFSSLVEVR